MSPGCGENREIHLPVRFHIGLQRAGSTYLYNLLKSHSGVSLSRYQEVSYYTRNYRRGAGWYTATFDGQGVRVDMSPAYFRKGAQAAPRIHEALGSSQPLFLLILRNPVDYIHSYFQMNLRSGRFSKDGARFKKAPGGLIDFVKRNPAYLERGLYADILEHQWLEYFEQTAFRIIFFEEFVQDTESYMKAILDFFGIPHMRMTAAASSRNSLYRFGVLYRLRDFVIHKPKMKEWLKRSSVFNCVYRNLLTSGLPALKSDERAWLRDYFYRDVQRLRQIVGHLPEQWSEFR